MIGNRDSRSDFGRYFEKLAGASLSKKVKEVLDELKIPQSC